MAQLNVEKLSGDINTLDINGCINALMYSLESDQPIGIEGPPGVGKSTIVGAVAQKIKLPFEPLLLSLCDPTDIGGFPVTDHGKIERLPLGVIKRACDEPVILFLDELTCAPPATQGAALRLIYERWAGDRKLHKGTRIVAAFNPPNQAAGGWEFALPLIGRMTLIKMRPTIKEIQNYFYNLGSEKSTLRALATDLAATLEMAPELIQIDPPAGAVGAGTPWGSPRSWERALKLYATALDSGEKEQNENRSNPLIAGLLAGNVGEDGASAWMTIRKVRNSLPSIKEVSSNPKGARLPQDANSSIAVLGILVHVARQDPCPAWIYTNRLSDETRIAAMNIMGQYGIKGHKQSPFYGEAEQAQDSLIRSIGDMMRGN